MLKEKYQAVVSKTVALFADQLRFEAEKFEGSEPEVVFKVLKILAIFELDKITSLKQAEFVVNTAKNTGLI
jgi:hypothetical protein